MEDKEKTTSNLNLEQSLETSDEKVVTFSPQDEREAIFDVPVKLTAVVGDVKMPVRELVRLGRGAIVSLNKKLGSSIDIYANGRLIARGEITIVEDDDIAVTMTDIISSPLNR